ncbi:MAG: hypothetical protein AAFX85_10580 [Pseudomonadota bacterium]
MSGKRVVCRCEVEVKTYDPFATWNNVKKGHAVLNIRGGCLYLGEYFDERNVSKLFPKDGLGTFIKMTLSADRGPAVVLEDVQVAFQRIKKEANREGVVFTFIDVTEKQLDVLFGLDSKLPLIGPSEEESVPFEELISLDRANRPNRL